MNQFVKYRAYHENYGMFVPTELVLLHGKIMYVGRVFSDEVRKMVTLPVEEVVLEKWVGMSDENDVEVYPGDIVNVWDSTDGEDAFLNTLVVRESAFGIYFEEACSVKAEDVSDESEGKMSVTVIGNVHQHPDMVEL
ncbi:YopX family protein [Weissella tructae]|uniref:YopX family protein n=1 Tax=Weissella tructae TaxID=887702 RepID=UPI003D8C0F56